MRQLKNTSKPNMTIHRMFGGATEQFDNLLQTLKWLEASKPTLEETYAWLEKTFTIKRSSAKQTYSRLLGGSGLVEKCGERCYLTRDGQFVLDCDSSATLFALFEERTVGISTFLTILSICDRIDFKTLQAMWYEEVKEQFPGVQKWDASTLYLQCSHRINWLRSMGLIIYANGRYALSESGREFILINAPEISNSQYREIVQQERQLSELVSGQFQLFDDSVQEERFSLKAVRRNRNFREKVTDQYEYYCAVCGFRLRLLESCHYEVEAAHIVPKHKNGVDDPRNGIALCKTHHWAFDKGIISVRPDDLTVITASYLEDQKNDTSIQQILQLRGRPIRSVKNKDYAPAAKALEWHNQHIFLG